MEDKIKDLLTRNARTNLFNELNRIRLAKELNELFINETDIAKSKKAVTNKSALSKLGKSSRNFKKGK